MKNRLHNLYFNKVVCGDCLEVMQEFPDNFVDTIITDPPYGLSKQPDIAEARLAAYRKPLRRR